MKVEYPIKIKPGTVAIMFEYLPVYHYRKDRVIFYSQTNKENHDILAVLKVKENGWKH
jgi:hypothetical protein